jgi:uncharacterized membrane protein
MIRPRIDGHPIHIILAHFPSALLPASVVCSSLYYFTGNKIAGYVALYNMIAGVGTAWLTIVFGLWESLLVPAHKTKIVATIFWHASFNAIMSIVFTLWTAKAWSAYPEVEKDSTLLLIFKWVAIGALIVGNYMGGKLLLKHHVGITKTLPEE